MNIELLEKIRKHILEEPKRINMKTWIINPFIQTEKLSVLKKKNKAPSCNTVGCIAGWTQQLSSKGKIKRFDLEIAREELRLTNNEANRLFLLRDMSILYHWPPYFEEELKKTNPGTRAYARIVSARIKHFIKTKGEE